MSYSEYLADIIYKLADRREDCAITSEKFYRVTQKVVEWEDEAKRKDLI